MRWLVLVLVAACGRVGFDAGGGSGPGGGDGGGGGGGGGGGDGAIDTTPIDALISPGCGTTTIVASDFSTTTSGFLVSGIVGNYATSQSGGLQHFDSTGMVTAAAYAFLHQVQSVSFTDTCAIAELVQVPAPAVAFVYLRLGTATNNVEMRVSNGQISGKFTNGGTSGTVGPLVYDAVAMRFLRIRNVADVYHFEAGPSLAQFPTSLGTESGALVMPSPSTLELGLSTTANTTGVSAAFDSVRFLGP